MTSHSNNPYIIIEDTREKPRAVTIINKQIKDSGYKLIRHGLIVGDYQLMCNPYYCIDRKQSLLEICGNIASSKNEHKRFREELLRAQNLSIRLCILIEEEGYKSIDDVENWVNPRHNKTKYTTEGKKLCKALHTIQKRYGVDIEFCNKEETGLKIIELLEEHNCER